MKSKIIYFIAGLDQLGKTAVRFGIVVVFLWIGCLKFCSYEAEGIVPFVANSPFMSFFYHLPNEYKAHKNKEGEFVAKNHLWHQKNNTYYFADGLGVFLISLGLLIALYRIIPLLSLIASVMVLFMTLGTLSFLVTTPEAWVPQLGGEEWGFPYLSGAGRLVIKDIVILGGAIVTMSETAKLLIKKKNDLKHYS